ncbi:right-handed parallel beta-helix repeat-containing protein [Candidatus Sumerlaeota bacterium]|nr:right-handed parallel beta-helix repeat-containing protein [Candidatus Sumerlaeota bacterium]
MKTLKINSYVMVLVLFLASQLSYSAVIKVKKDGTGDATTVQGGINLATTPGDIVEVYSGTYTEDLTMPTESITIRAAAGESVSLVSAGADFDPATGTVFDGSQPGASLSMQYFIIGTGALTLQNLTYTNISGKQAFEAGDVTIKNCTFELSDSVYGIVPAGNFLAEDSTFNCHNVTNGMLPTAGSATLRNVTFNGNGSPGIAVGFHAATSISLNNVTINDWGHAIVNNAGLSVCTCSITNCTINRCGEVVTVDAGAPVVTMSDVTATSAELCIYVGGGGAHITADRCKFFGRPGGDPRAIHYHSGELSVTNSIFYNFDHAGVWIGSMSPLVTIDQCDFYYDGSYTGSEPTFLTGLLIDSPATVTFTDSIISGYNTRVNNHAGATISGDYNFYPNDGGVFTNYVPGAHSLVDNPGPLYYSTDPLSANFLKLDPSSPAATLNSTGSPPYAGSQGVFSTAVQDNIWALYF